MRRRSRTRRVLKWVGTLLCVLLLVAWSYSATHFIGLRSPHLRPFLGRGRLEVTWIGSCNTQFPVEWVHVRHSRGVRFDLDADYCRAGHLFGSRVAELALPLWIPFLLASAPTMYLWWLDRRRYLPGHCQNCGYDLTGNVSGRCPECGTPIDNDKAPDTNG